MAGAASDLAELHAQLFPKLAYDHQRLRYVMTDLTQLAEEFLVMKSLDEKPGLRSRLLMGSFVERRLDKYFSGMLDRSLKKLESDPREDSAYLFERFRLEEAGLNFDQQRRNRSGDRWIYPMLEDLRSFYLATRLKYVCELVNRRNIVSGELDQEIVADLQRQLKHSPRPDIPAIAIYRQVLATLIEEDKDPHYKELRRMLRAFSEQFEREELGQMYSFALNYCIQQLNRGRSDFLRELFEVYGELLAEKVIYEGGYLPPQHFKNIVTVGIRLREYDWTMAFLKEKLGDLPEAERKNASIYNSAALAFAQAEYAQCRRSLQQVEFTDVFYQLDSKSMLLKSYYELADWEPLLSLLDSFRIFLRRNKTISDYQRSIYLNLLKFVRKLVRIRMGSKMKVKGVAKEMEQIKEIADLGWLQEKVGELQ